MRVEEIDGLAGDLSLVEPSADAAEFIVPSFVVPANKL